MNKTNDKKKIAELEIKDKINIKQNIADLKEILDTNAGMRFFKSFLIDGNMFSTTFTGNSYSYFLEGRRALALKVFSDICQAAPEKVHELMIIKKEKEEEIDE